MALTKGTLGLTVRVKNSSMIADIPSSVKAAKQWLEELPAADMGETASKIFHYLYDLNQSPVSPKIRLQILEAIKNSCLNTLNSLATVYIHSPLKYSQKLQSASELVHAISSEVVFGFNTVIEDLYDDKVETAFNFKASFNYSVTNFTKLLVPNSGLNKTSSSSWPKSTTCLSTNFEKTLHR